MDEVAALPAPIAQPRAGDKEGLRELPDGAVLVRGVDRGVMLAFAEARQFGRRRAVASQSFWWTVGGESFRPLALSHVGLPSAVRFADLLTGAFADGEASALREAP